MTVDWQKRMRALDEGWTKISYDELDTDSIRNYSSWVAHDPNSKMILEWCEKTCSNEWAEFAGKFFFKDEQDAIMFSLKWFKGTL